MKEPPRHPHSRPKRPPPSEQKLKLLCSFNGAFLPCQPSGKLRYIGGETRIVSVNRGIGISQLLSKISSFCPRCPSISLKYHILEHGGVLPLVPIETDVEVRRMIEEYDKFVADGRNVRLRVFACHGNVYVGSNTGSSCSSSFNRFCSDMGISNSNDGVLMRGNGFGNKTSMTQIDRTCKFSDFFTSNRSQTKSTTTQLAGIQNPTVRRQQVSNAQIYQTQNSHDFFAIDASRTDISSGFLGKTRNSDRSFRQTALGPQTLTPHVTDRSEPQNLTTSRTEFQDLGSSCYLPRFQLELPFGGFRDGLDYASCNQAVGTVEFPNLVYNLKQGFRNFECLSRGDLNRENIMPLSTCLANLGRDLLPLKNLHGFLGDRKLAINNNQITTSDIEDNAIDSYDSRSVCNGAHSIGNHRNCGLDGKPCNGRCHAGPSPRSNISELGQAGSNCALLGKPSYGAYEHIKEGVGKTVSSGRGTRTLFDLEDSRGILKEMVVQPSNVRSQGDRLLETEFVNSNLRKTHLDNGCLHRGFSELKNLSHLMEYPSSSPCNVTKNPIPCFQAISSGDGHSCDSNLANHEIQSKHPCIDPFSNANQFAEGREDSFHYLVSSTPYCNNLERESESVYDTANPLHNWKSQGDRIHETLKSAAKESSSDCDLNDRSSVDLSLHTPTEVIPTHCSLSSSGNSGSNEGLPMHDHSSTNNSNISSHDYSPRSEMWPCFTQLHLINNKPLSSGLFTENMTESGSHERHGDYQNGTSDTSVKDVTKLGSSLQLLGPLSLAVARVSSSIRSDLDHGEEKRQRTPSSVKVEEKANVKASDCCYPVVGKIGRDLLAYYTQLLGTQELQTIRDSDLEEIRELGSGTYGTVYYGKWKGCDVAIKRIKPNCFVGGELAEDRLIADFWKEAHLLSQLHHPNIVAFYGVVTDGPAKNFATVTEYMVNGSLKQVLQRKDRTIDRRKRLIIAMDVAFGMEYLHEKNIVHFDLKSHNLLVNMKYPQRPVCKIGDFGLYKVKQKTLVSGGVRGTIPWMAPELLTSKSGMVTEKVDVYSFGIVMWELLSGEDPYASMRSEEILAGIIKGDLRPDVPNWCDPTWRSLMERCWSSDPISRPSFSEIAKELRAIAACMNIK